MKIKQNKMIMLVGMVLAWVSVQSAAFENFTAQLISAEQTVHVVKQIGNHALNTGAAVGACYLFLRTGRSVISTFKKDLPDYISLSNNQRIAIRNRFSSYEPCDLHIKQGEAVDAGNSYTHDSCVILELPSNFNRLSEAKQKNLIAIEATRFSKHHAAKQTEFLSLLLGIGLYGASSMPSVSKKIGAVGAVGCATALICKGLLKHQNKEADTAHKSLKELYDLIMDADPNALALYDADKKVFFNVKYKTALRSSFLNFTYAHNERICYLVEQFNKQCRAALVQDKPRTTKECMKVLKDWLSEEEIKNCLDDVRRHEFYGDKKVPKLLQNYFEFLFGLLDNMVK